MDIETAFLHGILGLGEKIFREIPDGMPLDSSTDCLLLEKTIYGLVQSAQAFYLQLKAALKDIGFTVSPPEPCLFTKYTATGPVFMVLHVNNCYTVSPPQELEIVAANLRKHFAIKITPNLNDYLSCQIIIDPKTKTVKMVLLIIRNHLFYHLAPCMYVCVCACFLYVDMERKNSTRIFHFCY